MKRTIKWPQYLCIFVIVGLFPSTSFASQIFVTYELNNVLVRSPLGWLVDFSVPYARPTLNGHTLMSVEVQGRINVLSEFRAETTIPGYYGFMSAWNTRIFSPLGLCCEDRTDGDFASFVRYDGGTNNGFYASTSGVDTFNMNEMISPAILSAWSAGDPIELSMEVTARDTGLVYIFEPPSVGNVTQWAAADCSLCWGQGPDYSKYLLHPELKISASLEQVVVIYGYDVPEPNVLTLVAFALLAGVGLHKLQKTERV